MELCINIYLPAEALRLVFQGCLPIYSPLIDHTRISATANSQVLIPKTQDHRHSHNLNVSLYCSTHSQVDRHPRTRAERLFPGRSSELHAFTCNCNGCPDHPIYLHPSPTLKPEKVYLSQRRERRLRLNRPGADLEKSAHE